MPNIKEKKIIFSTIAIKIFEFQWFSIVQKYTDETLSKYRNDITGWVWVSMWVFICTWYEHKTSTHFNDMNRVWVWVLGRRMMVRCNWGCDSIILDFRIHVEDPHLHLPPHPPFKLFGWVWVAVCMSWCKYGCRFSSVFSHPHSDGKIYLDWQESKQRSIFIVTIVQREQVVIENSMGSGESSCHDQFRPC